MATIEVGHRASYDNPFVTFTAGFGGAVQCVVPCDMSLTDIVIHPTQTSPTTRVRAIVYASSGTTANQPDGVLGSSSVVTGVVDSVDLSLTLTSPVSLNEGDTIWVSIEADTNSFTILAQNFEGYNQFWSTADLNNPPQTTPSVTNYAHNWAIWGVGTAAGSPLILGNLIYGQSTVQYPPANNKAVVKISVTSSIDFSRIWIGQINVNNTAAKIKPVVYADSSGVPGALIAVGDETIGTGSGRWQPLTFSSMVTLGIGDYWVGVISDTQNDGQFQPEGGDIYYNVNSYAGGASNPFGSPTLQGAFRYLLFVSGTGTPTTNVRLSLIDADAVTGGEPNVRTAFEVADVTTGGNPNVHMALQSAEAISGGGPHVRCPIIVLEVIFRIREEGFMAEAVFPTLRGLGWSVHRKPNFKTKVAEHISGHEVRASFMQYPRWEFNLTYEWLPNVPKSSGDTDLETIMGFFCERQGKYDEFLYRDPEAYLVTDQQFAVADGGTIVWPAVRKIAGFVEPVGQFDLTEQFTFVSADVDVMADTVEVDDHGYTNGYGPIQLSTSGTLPAGLLPLTSYWLIVVNSDTLKFATSPANAESGTAVAITDDGSADTFTAANSIAVYDNGTEVSPSGYNVSDNPNLITFDVAPTNTHVLTWSGKYFFVCTFLDDIHDYEEFLYRLYTLQECNFRSQLTIE